MRVFVLAPSCAALTFALIAPARGAERPNILWITCEDTGPQLGCYGDAYATTPNLDRLAARGLRFRNAWSNAPVCAPARTAIISGVYPTSTGSEHMRSDLAMPDFMRMYPQLLRAAGYYCTNNSKEDYNLARRGKVWDESSGKAHYKNRPPGAPFFAIFNLTVTHESQIRKRPHTAIHDPAGVRVPAYHPDTPEVRRDWAQYYDNIQTMDAQAGKLLHELEDASLAGDTIVFFYGDHGSGMPRSKRWPYNSGLSVPLIVHVPATLAHLAPKDYRPGGESLRLVGFVDLAPTLLSLAGERPSEWMQGRAFMGPFESPAPAYLHGFRGRMDERIDMVRSVRDERYVYVRNYMPHLPYGQHIGYMFETPTTRVWKRLHDEGALNAVQARFWLPKPPEELYDLAADPDETRNLADSPEHRAVLERLRLAQREHALAIRDAGFLSEAELHRRAGGGAVYDMARDESRYPLARIMHMADTASLLAPEALPALRAGLRDDDGAVRCWAMLGILMRGAPAFAAARDDVRAALADSSPSVRIAAARILGEHGDENDLRAALDVLRALASPVANGAYVAIDALNAIDALGDKAAPLAAPVGELPAKDPSAPARANEYVARLVKHILEAQGLSQKAPQGTESPAEAPRAGGESRP